MRLFKLCPKCEQEKPFTEFHRASHTKDGMGGYCKKCGTAESLASYHSNPKTKTRITNYLKKHHIRLREAAKANAKNSPWIRIIRTLTKGLRKHTHHHSKVKTKLIKTHFESLFPSTGVSWDNYGTVWQTKRIKPIVKFDLSNPEEVAKINELSNLTIRVIPENERVPRK